MKILIEAGKIYFSHVGEKKVSFSPFHPLLCIDLPDQPGKQDIFMEALAANSISNWWAGSCFSQYTKAVFF